MDQNTQSNGSSIDIDKFRETYNKAVEDNKATFMFNDMPILTEYAKYMLEYVDSQFKTK